MREQMAELTFGDVLRILFDAWIVIGLLTFLGGAVAVIMALSAQPVYRAEVLLSPVTQGNAGSSALSKLAGQLGPLSGILGGIDGGGGLGGKDVWLATLRSRKLTEEFIHEKNLLPLLYPQLWDSGTGTWKVKNGKPAMPTMEAAFYKFNSSIRKVTEDKRTGLVTLTIDWRDPALAAQWANDLVARANESIRRRAVAEAQQSAAFLEDELKKTDVVELRQVIYRLIESKISDIMLANVRKEYAFAVVDPAVAPGPNNYISPRRRMMVGIGLLFGMFAGVVYAGIKAYRRAQRAR